MVRGWRRPVVETGGDAATSVQTLAVLLQAGAVPMVAWRHLASIGDRHAASVIARVDGGVPLIAATYIGGQAV